MTCRDCRWFEYFTMFEDPKTCRCPYCSINAMQMQAMRVRDMSQPCQCGHFVVAEGQVDSYDKEWLFRGQLRGPDRLGTDGEEL